jgi:hypothetical protein
MHVSDKYAPNNTYGLYGFLTQVRLAYMIGADLAAIAMCRAATEILIRYHYNTDVDRDLGPLIRQTQKRKENSFMRHHNLIAKIEEANKILHYKPIGCGVDDIQNQTRTRTLIREWVKTLQKMITKAPRLNIGG